MEIIYDYDDIYISMFMYSHVNVYYDYLHLSRST